MKQLVRLLNESKHRVIGQLCGFTKLQLPNPTQPQQSPHKALSVELHQVSKQFGSTPILNGVSLSLPAGKTSILMGASGCGKTTLLRLLNGLEALESGEITIGPWTITAQNPLTEGQWREVRKHVGMVFQQYTLFPHLTALQNITLGLRQVKQYSAQAATEKALALLKVLDLESKQAHYPYQLSGGQKQRVALARAVALEPGLLLLDEPTSALDPVMSADVFLALKQLAGPDMTILLVTHDLNFAQQVADHYILMDHGQVSLQGDLELLQRNAKHHGLLKALMPKQKQTAKRS